MIPDNCFLFTREDVKSCNQSCLFGYGITDNALIFGTDGLNKYRQQNQDFKWPVEGRFCGIFVDENEILFRTDKTGQDILFFFKLHDEWAVSNSFLLLLNYAAKRHELSFQPHIASCFHLKNGVHIGEQLISHKTMVKEINIIPINWKLNVCRTTGDPTFEKPHYLDEFRTITKDNYVQTIQQILEDGAGLIRVMSDQGFNLNPHISGGYDSRLVLCMISISGVKNRINVNSYPHKEDDFKSATKLCDYFGFDLNKLKVKNQTTLSAGEALRMFLLSCGGTYLPFYPVQDFQIREQIEIIITGDQPTGWSHFAGNAIFNGDADKISNDILNFFESDDIGKDLADEFLSTFDVLGIDKNHPASMLAHYTAIRSRHHCGRNWYKSLGSKLLFTPLMDSRFIGLDLYNQEQGIHPTQLFIDAFSATGDWALDIPFETPDRSFSDEQRKSSPFYGSIDLKPTQYVVYGHPSNTVDQNQKSIFSIPTNVGYNKELIETTLSRQFYASKFAKTTGIFSDGDLQAILDELKNKGSLSHGYRKLMHFIFVEIVKKQVQYSPKSDESLYLRE